MATAQDSNSGWQWAKQVLLHTIYSGGLVWWLAGKTAVLVYWLRLRLGVVNFSTAGEFVTQHVWGFQVGTGFAAGWLLSRYQKGKAAIWAWVLPATYLLFNILQWHSPFASVLAPAPWYDGIKHYFWGRCLGSFSDTQISLDCAKRIFVTGMFYCSASYSLGALLERRVATSPNQLT